MARTLGEKNSFVSGLLWGWMLGLATWAAMLLGFTELFM